MIDTDKYEGHAEGEWTIEQNETGDECAINAQDYGTIAQTFYRESDKLFYATTRLIADAPLLLAEVKRYKQVFDRAIECALNDNAEQAMQFLLNMDYCLDDEEIVTDENRKNYYWMNGEWRSRK